MAVLAVSGAHNSGKTTLIEKLLPCLRARGVRTAVIKHDGHDFTPDVPGTDSFRLREAGAEGVAVFSSKRYMLYEAAAQSEDELLEYFSARGYDLVLLEGFKNSAWPKIEVVRTAAGGRPVSAAPLAVVGDIPGADFGLDETARLTEWITEQMPKLSFVREPKIHIPAEASGLDEDVCRAAERFIEWLVMGGLNYSSEFGEKNKEQTENEADEN